MGGTPAGEPAARGSESLATRPSAEEEAGPGRQAPGWHHRSGTVEELPEGFQHWGGYAEKLVPSHLIPWTCASGRTVIQLQPETPPINKEGRPMKYLFPKGCGGMVGVIAGSEKTVLDPSVPLLVVEGTFQGRAVAAALEGCSFAVADQWLQRLDTGRALTGIWPDSTRSRGVLPPGCRREHQSRRYDAAKYLLKTCWVNSLPGKSGSSICPAVATTEPTIC